MTVRNPPVFLQTQEHPAEDVRRWLQAALWSTSGIVDTTDLAVTATTGLTVSIAGGRCFIAGTENTYQGTYYCENRGAATVTLTGANPTNPRIDLIVARIRDSVYSGLAASDGFTIEAVAGTPAATPVAPATPANSIVLAQVRVNAGATTVTGGNITDTRPIARRPGLQVFVTATARSVQYPTPVLGDISYLTAVNRYEVYNGSVWVRLAPIVTVSTAYPSGGEDGDVWIKVS